MTDLTTMSFEDQAVRMHLDPKGEPWWVLADVCRVLGLRNPTKAAEGLDDDERSTLTSSEGAGGPDRITVNEPGLYALIFKSRKPAAKRFKRWVTHEVLPSLQPLDFQTIPDGAGAAEWLGLGCNKHPLRPVAANSYDFNNLAAATLQRRMQPRRRTRAPARAYDIYRCTVALLQTRSPLIKLYDISNRWLVYSLQRCCNDLTTIATGLSQAIEYWAFICNGRQEALSDHG